MNNYNKSKISKASMIEEIKEELMNYFKKGVVNPKSFFKIDGIKFNNIHDILKIHFILSEQVQSYTLSLEREIKNIKNSTKLHKKLFNGEVRGNIDWNKTIEYRANTVYRDRSKFVCNNIDKLYDIKENLVLKKTISIIYNIIHREIGMDRFISEEWYRNGKAMSSIILNIYRKNVYIKRIDISKTEINDKMIADVLNSRNKIYRDSARILKLYRDIMKFDEKEIGNLFSKTFIDMQDENKVFELYSIFKYMKENFSSEKIKYNILDGKEDSLANIEDDRYIYEIYHDSIGKGDISFNIVREDIENSNNEYLNRKIKILDMKNSIYNHLKGRSATSSIWGGRPDLLIIKKDKLNKAIVHISIGEIKYTNNRDYMYTGLDELLDYIYLIKDKNSIYIDDIPISGLLFVDNIYLEKNSFQNIEIISRETSSDKIEQ